MSKANEPESDDTLSDVLGDELASKLRTGKEPIPLPGPAPWEKKPEAGGIAASTPLAVLPPESEEVEEITTGELIASTHEEEQPAPPASPELPPAEKRAAPPIPVPTAPTEAALPPLDPSGSPALAPQPQFQSEPEPGPEPQLEPGPEPAPAPTSEPEHSAGPDSLGSREMRGTDEIVAQVMPVRRFGKRHADWAESELWPKLRRMPADVLAPAVHRAWQAACELGRQVAAWPTPVKAAAGAGTILVVAVILALWISPWSTRQFIQEPTWLLAGPSLDEGQFPRVAALHPREPVEIVRELETLVLVTDSVGRAGYVARSALGDQPPRPAPDQPFSRCGRLPGESDPGPCDVRAETQRAECLLACEEMVDVAGCTGNCEMHNNNCIASCENVLASEVPEETEATDTETETQEPATAEPSDPTAAPEDAPPDATAAPAVEETRPPKPPVKKKPTRKKRRRSRKRR